MNTLHTPGPWFAIQYANQWCIQSKDGYEFGASHDVIDEENDPNHEANARLIAAAPEMLEALKSTMNDSMFEDLHKETKAIITAIIAKAIGGDK